MGNHEILGRRAIHRGAPAATSSLFAAEQHHGRYALRLPLRRRRPSSGLPLSLVGM